MSFEIVVVCGDVVGCDVSYNFVIISCTVRNTQVRISQVYRKHVFRGT